VHYRFIILSFAVIFLTNKAFAQQTQIKLATTPWCPYTCNNEKQPHGIVGQYLTELLAESNILLTIESYPWARAIELAKAGKVHGLLTAIPAEAPSLEFTTTETMSYQVCFFTRVNEAWTYQAPLTTNGKRLGVINQYGYGEEVTNFTSQPQNKKSVMSISGQDSLPRLITMLQSQRLDILVEDVHVLTWQMKTLNLPLESVRNAGCLKAHSFYIAFNSHHKINQQLIEYLNIALQEQHHMDRLHQLIQPFQISP
jgi:polar amino acid transport system substrate-binding protein